MTEFLRSWFINAWFIFSMTTYIMYINIMFSDRYQCYCIFYQFLILSANPFCKACTFRIGRWLENAWTPGINARAFADELMNGCQEHRVKASSNLIQCCHKKLDHDHVTDPRFDLMNA